MDVSDLQAEIALDPTQFLGIPLALVGAVFLSLGAQFQHRGVGKVESSTSAAGGTGLSVRQLMLLLSRPSWVLGTLMLALAIVFQLASLSLAPLIVVQPLGAVALVITSIVNSRVHTVHLTRPSIFAIMMCVGGVFLFVVVAAFTAVDRPVGQTQLIVILVILIVVLVLLGIAFAVFRRTMKAVFYVLGAGVLYGFVATLAKVIIGRLKQGEIDALTVICAIALIAAMALGAYFVQNAYASGPPDLVIAGLTVVDPLVAVGVGIIVLGEASQAPLWAMVLFLVSGAIAIAGVFQLARHHPQTKL